ncbi:hypothetical protein NMY22_g4051 [Coprinellus aureogranulatus]|nr:hypothetical protein NMY22_g4051 [Coprinellus aureogranulatus]
MTSWLFPSYTVTLTRSVNAPAETVLAIIQDPEQYFFLSPLIKHAEPDPRDPDNPFCRVLTERLPIIGSFGVNTTIYGRMSLLPEGIAAEADAGAGTRVTSRLTVKARGESCEVLNECTVQVSLFSCKLDVIEES